MPIDYSQVMMPSSIAPRQLSSGYSQRQAFTPSQGGGMDLGSIMGLLQLIGAGQQRGGGAPTVNRGMLGAGTDATQGGFAMTKEELDKWNADRGQAGPWYKSPSVFPNLFGGQGMSGGGGGGQQGQASGLGGLAQQLGLVQAPQTAAKAPTYKAAQSYVPAQYMGQSNYSFNSGNIPVVRQGNYFGNFAPLSTASRNG
jgi:hypothetical protein